MLTSCRQYDFAQRAMSYLRWANFLPVRLAAPYGAAFFGHGVPCPAFEVDFFKNNTNSENFPVDRCGLVS